MTPLPVGRTDLELATVVSPRRGYATSLRRCCCPPIILLAIAGVVAKVWHWVAGVIVVVVTTAGWGCRGRWQRARAPFPTSGWRIARAGV